MEGFNLSFENIRVRIWFFIVMPILLITFFLFIFLPRELQLIPTLLPITVITIYFGWLLIGRNKAKKDTRANLA